MAKVKVFVHAHTPTGTPTPTPTPGYDISSPDIRPGSIKTMIYSGNWALRTPNKYQTPGIKGIHIEEKIFRLFF